MLASMRLVSAIVNWRTPDMTIDAVRALLPEIEGIDGEVIVVDNDSGDGSFEKISAAVQSEGWSDRVRVIASGKNGGYGFGNNIAFREGLRSETPPDFFYVLNSDAFPDKGSIKALLDFMQTHPRCGLAGSYVHGVDGVPHHTAFRFPSAAGELESQVRLGLISRMLADHIVALEIPETATQVDWVAGASMMVRRSTLEEIGLFDETFFLYFEETDLCRRARDAGWSTWYVPESSVAHIGSASTGIQDLDKRTPTYWFDSRRHYYIKNMGRGQLWFANAAWIVGASIWNARRRVERKPRQDAPKLLFDFVRYSLRR